MYRVHYIFTPHKLETTAAAMEEAAKFGKNMAAQRYRGGNYQGRQ